MILKNKISELEKSKFINMLNGEIQFGKIIKKYPKYKIKIDNLFDAIIGSESSNSLYIDFSDLKHLNDENEILPFQQKIIENPEYYIESLNYIYTEFLVEKYGKMILEHLPFIIRIDNVPYSDIKASNIGKLIKQKVTVKKTSEPYPILEIGKYKCKYCNSVYETYQYFINEPVEPVCKNIECFKKKQKFEFLRNSSKYIDFQYAICDVFGSSKEIYLFITDDLLGLVKPGRIFECSGTLSTIYNLKLKKKIIDKQKMFLNLDKKWNKDSVEPKYTPFIIANSLKMIGIEEN